MFKHYFRNDYIEFSPTVFEVEFTLIAATGQGRQVSRDSSYGKFSSP